MASSSSSSETCLNFITHLLQAFIDTVIKVFSDAEIPEEGEQLPQAFASSSSSGRVKHQVFLSFRGEDTRLNFTAHLLKELKVKGIKVFFDEQTLEKGELLSPALSQGIADSRLSVIVFSVDYASSKSCLAELSDIMHRKETQGHIVLPIFYHVDPSHVRHLGGSFKKSFEDHESKRLHQVQRWKAAFAQVGKLKGWHIEGGKFDRPDTEYIEDVVEYVIKKLNSESRSVSEELVGIDDQKKVILGLIQQEESRVIGLWGMGGIGKTTLAESVYNEISPKFQSHCFLHNVREEIKNKGMKSVRNELLSKLLNSKIEIETPTIVSDVIKERLNNIKLFVVFDDVDDSDQIDLMGVKHFGDGSKIILTARDKQVLKNGRADKIHEVKKLNEEDSLQLFSTFAFKQLHPAAEFLHLSYQFIRYADGSPLALTILGSQLYEQSEAYWKSEADKLKEYAPPKISLILRRSYDNLDEPDKRIFLDIACFFKGESKAHVEEILCCLYKGVVSGISNLVDKCLIAISPSKFISMHDMLEEMGKNIVVQESKSPGMRSRLWSPTDASQVFKYNKGTESIEGIKLDMSEIDILQLRPTVFENMHNLKFICFSYSNKHSEECLGKQPHVDTVSFPDELRYFYWHSYPFKSLSSFNPLNLVVLKLPFGDMEQLWNEDNHQGLVNLREVDLYECKKLSKIPSLLGATRLEILGCYYCESLIELPCLSHLASLKTLELTGCDNLKRFPEVPKHFSELNLIGTRIEEVPDSIEHLVGLEELLLGYTSVEKVSSNISKLESLHTLNLSRCLITEFPEVPSSLEKLQSNITLSGLKALDTRKLQRKCSEVGAASSNLRFKSLRYLIMDQCNSLRILSELPPYLQYLGAYGCTSLKKVSFTDQNRHLYERRSFYSECEDDFYMIFSNCFSLDQHSVDNIEANAILKIRFLAMKSISEKRAGEYGKKRLMCCFPGRNFSENKFDDQSVSSSLILKIDTNGYSGSRFMVFAICLVVNLTNCQTGGVVDCVCEYQLAAGGAGYEKSISRWHDELVYEFMGDHVLILFSDDMVIVDKNYEEASFEFYVKYCEDSDREAPEVDVKVQKCGVHVSYVDADEKFSFGDVELG